MQNFLLYFLLIEYRNITYFYFNPVNNKEKNETERQFCFSDYVAARGMA